MEYRGHWIRLSRPHGSPETIEACRKVWENGLENQSSSQNVWERLDGSYPYDSGQGTISAFHIETSMNGKRLFYGDTVL
jgi:hypothetical protein